MGLLLRRLGAHACAALVYLPGLVVTAIFNYNVATKSLGVAFAAMASIHVSLTCGLHSANAVISRQYFMFFYDTRLKMLFVSAYQALGGAAVFAYATLHLDAGGGSEFTDTVARIFKVHTVVVGLFAVIQLLSIASFVGCFVVARRALWADIVELEDSITFHEEVKEQFETMRTLQQSQHYKPSSFVRHWMEKTDEDILRDSPIKAAKVFGLLSANLDINSDGIISHTEFQAFAETHNVFDQGGKVWYMLTNYSHDPAVPPAPGITEKRLQEVIYNLDFLRRRFCLTLYTDYIVNQWATLYLSVPAYGMAALLLANVFEYSSAFGTGFDLFKVYIAVITFLFSLMADNIKFVWMMIYIRPYNVGDILLVNTVSYKVTDISPGYTYCLGPTSMVIRNSTSLFSNPMLNLSRSFVTDAALLSIPPYADVSIADVRALLVAHANSSHEIDADRIQCGWEGIDSSVNKVMKVSWRYKVVINDRYRYNRMRLAVTNLIVTSLADSIGIRFMRCQVAQGGGLNANEKYVKAD